MRFFSIFATATNPYLVKSLLWSPSLMHSGHTSHMLSTSSMLTAYRVFGHPFFHFNIWRAPSLSQKQKNILDDDAVKIHVCCQYCIAAKYYTAIRVRIKLIKIDFIYRFITYPKIFYSMGIFAFPIFFCTVCVCYRERKRAQPTTKCQQNKDEQKYGK